MANALYNINEDFGFQVGAGYAISANGGDGGLTYSFGPFWNPTKALTLLVKYKSITLGEGNLGGVFVEARIPIIK